MENNNGKFSNGFLLGLIIGAALVFFLGTEKGKKLLKTISEDGLESLSEFFEEEADYEEFVEPLPKDVKSSHSSKDIKQEDQTNGQVQKPVKRRFFRRKK